MIKECHQCKKEYNGRINSIFCSVECRNNSRKRRVVRICKTCNKEYETKISAKKMFCSVNCKCTAWSEFNKKYPRRIRITLYCIVCHKEFEVKKERKTTAKYCSLLCKYKDHAIITKFSKGEHHYNWRGGVTSEDKKIRRSNDYDEWRDNILKKDDYTCAMCGQRGGKLEVDHIKPFKLFPNLRFSIDNGQVLCKDCHYKKGGKDTTKYGYRGHWKTKEVLC